MYVRPYVHASCACPCILLRGCREPASNIISASHCAEERGTEYGAHDWSQALTLSAHSHSHSHEQRCSCSSCWYQAVLSIARLALLGSTAPCSTPKLMLRLLKTARATKSWVFAVGPIHNIRSNTFCRVPGGPSLRRRLTSRPRSVRVCVCVCVCVCVAPFVPFAFGGTVRTYVRTYVCTYVIFSSILAWGGEFSHSDASKVAISPILWLILHDLPTTLGGGCWCIRHAWPSWQKPGSCACVCARSRQLMRTERTNHQILFPADPTECGSSTIAHCQAVLSWDSWDSHSD